MEVIDLALWSIQIKKIVGGIFEKNLSKIKKIKINEVTFLHNQKIKQKYKTDNKMKTVIIGSSIY